MSQPSSDPRARRADVEIGLMIALMLLVGLAGWKLSARSELAVDPSPLAELPERIGPWQAMDVPLPPAVETELRADFNLQRAYGSATQIPLLLYVGYYGTRRGGRPEHTPQGCYTGAGWGIEDARTLSIATGDEPLRANEYLVERDGERQLVVFWYRSYRRTGLLGGLDQNLDRLVGLLRHGRADGALVRLSTLVLDGDIVGARSRLQSFASLVDPLLAAHWPVELDCGDGRSTGCERFASVELGGR
ncbi:MAG: EpsI family protein [Myxococcota bacterium]